MIRVAVLYMGAVFIFAHGVYTGTRGRKRIGIRGQPHLALHVLRCEKRRPVDSSESRWRFQLERRAVVPYPEKRETRAKRLSRRRANEFFRNSEQRV